MKQSTKTRITFSGVTALAGAVIAYGWAVGVIRPTWLAILLAVAALVASVVIKDALRNRTSA